MTKQQSQKNIADRHALYAYFTGFGLSIFLTLIAYAGVTKHVDYGHATLSHRAILYSVMALAFMQFIVQIVFFLHLGRESKPQWNRIALYFMIMVVTILVAGSLWIMDNLDYRHPHVETPTDAYIIEDEIPQN